METLKITFQTDSADHVAAVKAFFKALKIKHSISKEEAVMSEEAYYKMLNKRIKNAKKSEPVLIDRDLQNELLVQK